MVTGCYFSTVGEAAVEEDRVGARSVVKDMVGEAVMMEDTVVYPSIYRGGGS